MKISTTITKFRMFITVKNLVLSKSLLLSGCFSCKVVFTALHRMQTPTSDENSVCLSVRPSVKRVNFD